MYTYCNTYFGSRFSISIILSLAEKINLIAIAIRGNNSCIFAISCRTKENARILLSPKWKGGTSKYVFEDEIRVHVNNINRDFLTLHFI